MIRKEFLKTTSDKKIPDTIFGIVFRIHSDENTPTFQAIIKKIKLKKCTEL